MSESAPVLRIIEPVNAVSKAVSRELTEALRPFGLSFAQFSMIDLIDRSGHQYPSSLARRLEIETSTMASTLKRAERDGFILRSPDPNDARGVLVTITDHSRDILPKARDAVYAVEQRCAAGISGKEFEDGLAFLRKITMNLKV
ncbi:MarR family winged helix-turn-helix transcriptional regulator [Roseinatronobacter bogoriensis]|uniref:MarR family transcriptional regulator n=1 Tax=Roseinatronobacter bogoriensis subsp. barguzinensis TaxID=441209 RepID=A0A2K8K777_9RHOB|nr:MULTISPECIES: MarR family transcriptional regulator [Rhodobaca]ATX65289.1 MarR family transcriptional regulator [Rhodobaca barguzinensis]MBB4209406.1 DNA-binding MarR family transcriptional regulator [Rhodobaca bogoriensis DSM 18756]TDW34535.1 DNA-binding MarR family transcriptional regulator [Rhodobaca barguzinensis]TDY67147.1 MarR family transcriptional regulator [Rhodobaca bogoriensis DSM 18756]